LRAVFEVCGRLVAKGVGFEVATARRSGTAASAANASGTPSYTTVLVQAVVPKPFAVQLHGPSHVALIQAKGSELVLERRSDERPELSLLQPRQAQAIEGVGDAPRDAVIGIGEGPVEVQKRKHPPDGSARSIAGHRRPRRTILRSATASAATGTNPAADTRFGSSNPAETAWGLWESCIYEMPVVWWKTEP